MKETSRSNSTRDRLARLLRLVMSLRTERFPNATELAVVCGVSRRTIFRDMDVLDRAGYPVQYRPDQQGYQITSAQAEPAVLNEREAVALLIFSRQAELDGGALGSSARAATRKIVNSLADDTRGRVVELAELIIVKDIPIPLDQKRAEIHDAIVYALSSRKQARVRLKSRDEKQNEFDTTKLSPYRLVAAEGSWFLIARSSWHRRVIAIPLDAIMEIQATEDIYEIPPRFDFEPFLESVLAPRSTPDLTSRHRPRARLRTQNGPEGSPLSKLVDGKTA